MAEEIGSGFDKYASDFRQRAGYCAAVVALSLLMVGLIAGLLPLAPLETVALAFVVVALLVTTYVFLRRSYVRGYRDFWDNRYFNPHWWPARRMGFADAMLDADEGAGRQL